jgi:hypothetical protein
LFFIGFISQKILFFLCNLDIFIHLLIEKFNLNLVLIHKHFHSIVKFQYIYRGIFSKNNLPY